MATSTQQESRIPSHLRHFLRPSLTTVPLETQAPYSYTLSKTRPSSAVELCPPHWRLPLKRSLRSKLKSIVLKTPADATREKTLQLLCGQQRPPMMRMKDSDDYITARAANPRTGLISPSVGTPSPRAPCTPDTPGAALKQLSPSPRPEIRARPALSRADEGRKVSAGSVNRWRADTKGWVPDTTLAAASPRETPATAGASLATAPSQRGLKDDQFVISMPSAREPQPYTYPGRTAAEIEAFEHYRLKTRRISGEGYGERKAGDSGRPSGGIRKTSAGHHPAATRQHVRTDRPAITVAKRLDRTCNAASVNAAAPSVGGAELSAANFAPFSSPRTPAPRCGFETTALKTVKAPIAFRDNMMGHSPYAALVARKPVSLAPGSSIVVMDNRHVHNQHEPPDSARNPHLTDLSQLPRVELIHPDIASLPQDQALRQRNNVVRRCSFGCRKQEDTGECLESNQASNHSAPYQRWSLFQSHAAENHSSKGLGSGDALDLLISVTTAALNAGKHIQLPNISLLEALSTPSATPQQKVEALKALLTLTAQALAFLMVVTMVWRLGAAIAHVLEIVLWPLAVPFKILRWLLGVG